MIGFIRELRRREVFRTVGLYVGVCWILIEAASILLPAFRAPEWTLRGLVIVAIIGLPIVAALAWIFDITDQGIHVQADAPVKAATPALGARRMDFVVIGVLAGALAFSVYLNVAGRADVIEQPAVLPVLIADVENGTGDPIFDGLIERALTIGLEAAPHIVAFDGHAAASASQQLRLGIDGLPVNAARLVAVREGVKLVLESSIDRAEGGFRLALRGANPLGGETVFEVSTRAATRDGVLVAVSALAAAARDELGDETADRSETATEEAFTAASIEAARAYVDAVELALEGRHAEAIERFRAATGLDPSFGRAFAGWAASEFKLGRADEAADLWTTALSLMSRMTERERLRTLGTYYVSVTRDYEMAVETFAELLEKYPADAAGRNKLAVSAFMQLDFERAAAEGARILEVFPDSSLYRSSFALYAMYSSRFDVAAAEAERIVQADPDYGTAYLPLAISRLATGDIAGAREAYARMAAATRSEHGESVSALGLADVSIYTGELGEARALLRQAIERDRSRNDLAAAAQKQIALAESFVASGDGASAIDAAEAALALAPRDTIKIAAALVFLDAGDVAPALVLAEELGAELGTHARAYAMLVEARALMASGELVAAIDRLRSAIEIADLWRLRLALGRAYLEAGFFAEAFGELQRCAERRGEASAMFLDDMPTFRYLAELPYWLGRSQEGLGMTRAAHESYQAFLALRARGGPLADDARGRLP